MLDTNNHLYQWLKSPTCTILGTKNDRCLQDKIILDSIILFRNSSGWYHINQYIKYPNNSMNTIFLTNYNDKFLDLNFDYCHPFVDRIPYLEQVTYSALEDNDDTQLLDYLNT